MTTGSIISPATRERVRGLAVPIATAIGRLGLTPNHLTLIGFGIAIIAGVAAWQRSWLAAGLLVLFGGAFDLLDGALARATGNATRFGAFMDSVFDRWGEAAVYLGIAAGCVAAGFYVGAWLAAAAMGSAALVSYVRAKSEGLGFTPGSGMASVGIAPREVRIVILALGLIVASILGGVGAGFIQDCAAILPPDSIGDCFGDGNVLLGSWAISVALGLIAVLATITTIQRILHVRAQAKEG